jgi:type VI secretion system protein ImpM
VATGWFGKLPSFGDFAVRRLPSAFMQRWDDWLQHGLLAAREALGDDWLRGRAGAPLRRFWLSPGVVDARGAWTGVLTPSFDRVGRSFPLTLTARLPAQASTLAVAIGARYWFAVLDAVTRRALDGALTVDALEEELAQPAVRVLAPKPDANAGALARTLLHQFARTERSVRERAPQVALNDADAAPWPVTAPCSVWWCGEARTESQFLCFDGLPPPSALATLLSPSQS